MNKSVFIINTITPALSELSCDPNIERINIRNTINRLAFRLELILVLPRRILPVGRLRSSGSCRKTVFQKKFPCRLARVCTEIALSASGTARLFRNSHYGVREKLIEILRPSLVPWQ